MSCVFLGRGLLGRGKGKDLGQVDVGFGTDVRGWMGGYAPYVFEF